MCRVAYGAVTPIGFNSRELLQLLLGALILDYGEDPESITLAEINTKFHRFLICGGMTSLRVTGGKRQVLPVP